MRYFLAIFFTFLSITTIASEPQLVERIDQLHTEFLKLKENDFEPYSERYCFKIYREMRDWANNEEITPDTRSNAHLLAGAYLGVVPLKIIRSRNIFRLDFAIEQFKKSFRELKLSIKLNPYNELAIIMHAKSVYQGFKMKKTVERKTGIDLDREKALAIEELERIPYSEDPDRDKYYRRLLELEKALNP